MKIKLLSSIALIILFSGCAGTKPLDEALTEIAADGHPVKISQVVPAKVSDDENAALHYRKAFNSISETHPPKDNSASDAARKFHKETKAALEISYKENLNKEEIATLNQYFDSKQWQNCLKHLEAAVQLPKYNMDLDYEMGFSLLLTHLSFFRNVTRLLVLESRLIFLQGDNPKERLLFAAKMNAHLRQEPVIITQLVRMGGERLILRELSKLRTLSADDMQVIMANCDIALSKAAINHALHTERVVTTKSLRRILLEKKGNKMSLLKQVGYPLTGNNMIRMMFWTKGRFAADIAEYNRRMLELNAKFMDPSKDLDTEREIADDYPFTAMLLPALNGILINHLAFEAHIQVNHAGIALKRHYQKHSAVPESLDALKLNESIIDPFTGKRHAYIKTDISATIYSIGKNKKDDEGINKGKKDDITFRLELK